MWPRALERGGTALRAAVIGAVALTMLTACTDDGQQASPDTTTPATTATTTTTQASPTATGAPTTSTTAGRRRLLPPIGVATESGDATAQRPARLVDVRVGRHQTFDRVVFEYRGGRPGYEVRYGEATEPGSGRPADIPGDADLVMTFRNAHARDYDGPTTLRPALPAITAVRFVGGFEGMTTWGVGAPARLGFRVLELSSPPRLAIDVAHPRAFARFGQDCGDIRIDPVHRAGSIVAKDTGCDVARDIARAAVKEGPPKPGQVHGFDCRSERAGASAVRYLCTKGAAAASFLLN